MLNPIEQYSVEHLIPRLSSCSVPEHLQSVIVEDIERRLNAVISRWNDISFRQTLLTTVREIAEFYRPSIHIDTRCLVVIAIRNSVIEDICSTKQSAQRFGLNRPIDRLDADIRVITREAIKYFGSLNLSEIARQTSPEEDAPFHNLPEEYPLTWNAFKALSQCQIDESYDALSTEIKKVRISQGNEANQNVLGKKNTVVLSGMDETIGTKLQLYLDSIRKGELSGFFTDSFKTLSRSSNKLFKVMEFVLEQDSSVVTINYFIRNGYVAKRKHLIRPMHNDSELVKKLGNTNGCVPAHKHVLDMLREAAFANQ